jgi:hypothetical protein
MKPHLTCLGLWILFSPSVSAQDHLSPAVDVFVKPDSYLLKARHVFIQAFDNGVILRALVLPSFRKEFSVGVIDQGEQVEAFVLEPSSSIWGAELLEECQIAIKAYEKDNEKVPQDLLDRMEDLKKDAVDYRTIKAVRRSRPLPRNLSEEINSVWRKMLLDVRQPREPRRGKDGVIYYFSAWIKGRGDLSGQVWSPSKGSKTDLLTSLALAIGDYAREEVDLTMLKKKLEEARACIDQ